jgi:hypothetical protein
VETKHIFEVKKMEHKLSDWEEELLNLGWERQEHKPEFACQDQKAWMEAARGDCSECPNDDECTRKGEDCKFLDEIEMCYKLAFNPPLLKDTLIVTIRYYLKEIRRIGNNYETYYKDYCEPEIRSYKILHPEKHDALYLFWRKGDFKEYGDYRGSGDAFSPRPIVDAFSPRPIVIVHHPPSPLPLPLMYDFTYLCCGNLDTTNPENLKHTPGLLKVRATSVNYVVGEFVPPAPDKLVMSKLNTAVEPIENQDFF